MLTLWRRNRLGYHAFHRVLSRKSAVYAVVLASLVVEVRKPTSRVMALQLSKVVKAEENAFVEPATAPRRKRL